MTIHVQINDGGRHGSSGHGGHGRSGRDGRGGKGRGGIEKFQGNCRFVSYLLFSGVST
jgi:hypothetical protein